MLKIQVDHNFSYIYNLNNYSYLIDRLRLENTVNLSPTFFSKKSTVENVNDLCFSLLKRETNLYSLAKYQDNILQIYTGHLLDYINIFKKENIQFVFKKKYKTYSTTYAHPLLDLREEQKEFVELALFKKRGLIQAPTSFGKTRAIAEYLNQFNSISQKVVLVPTVNLLYQTQKELANYLKTPIGIVGDNQWLVENITVVLVDTLYNRIKAGKKAELDSLLNCEILVGDEVHTLANYRGLITILSFKKLLYALGTSATLNLKGLSLLTGLFGPVIKQFSLSEAMAKGYILQPEIKLYNAPNIVVPDSLVKDNYNHKKFNQLYDLGIVKNQKRNNLIAKIIANLIQTKQYPILVIVKKVGTTSTSKISHANLINQALASYNIQLPVLTSLTKNKAELFEQLEKSEILGLITTYKSLGIGVSINSLTVYVNAQGGSSTTENIQKVGRLLRKDSTNESKQPLVVDFIEPENTRWLRNASEKRLNLYQKHYGTETIKIL